MRLNSTLRLSNGDSFEGRSIGAPLDASGEMVFTTGMVGYSEALTDPSYFGQILVFTYPLIGNYGIPDLPKGLTDPLPRGFESNHVHVSGVIVTVDSPEAFHWTSLHSLDDWLRGQNVPGIVGLDTRHLAHIIRGAKNMLGSIETDGATDVRRIGGLYSYSKTEKVFFDPGQTRIIKEVSTKTVNHLHKGTPEIAVIDCGVKWNILRQLIDSGCGVTLVPWDADFSKIECDGWLISNGPGDPNNTGDLIERVTDLTTQDKPILGICLGHQILSMAAGLKTERMAYGHRSHNQPAQLVGTRRGFITSQNHGYVVKEDSLPDDWEIWFKNVNDETIEGIRHKTKPYRSVQFHPESAGGPRDTAWIMQDFVNEVKATCQ